MHAHTHTQTCTHKHTHIHTHTHTRIHTHTHTHIHIHTHMLTHTHTHTHIHTHTLTHTHTHTHTHHLCQQVPLVSEFSLVSSQLFMTRIHMFLSGGDRTVSMTPLHTLWADCFLVCKTEIIQAVVVLCVVVTQGALYCYQAFRVQGRDQFNAVFLWFHKL